MELGSYLDELDTRLADEVVFPGCRMEGIHCEGGGGGISVIPSAQPRKS